MKEEITLEVDRSHPADVSQGRVRIAYRNALGIAPGDIVEIIGDRE